MDTSALLQNSLGTLGPWQVMLITLIFLSKFSVAWHQLLMVAQQPLPEFECIDRDIDACSDKCPERIFDTSVFESTIITEWDLVCSKTWVPYFIQFIVMFGILVGNIVLGWVADRYGRKVILIVEIIVQIVSGCAAGLVSNLIVFCLLKFICTVATGGLMLTSFVLLMEFIGKKYRTLFGITFQLPFHLGHALLGPIAYLCPRWDYIQLACSIPNIILLSYICLLPESARWLLTKKRTEEVIKTLESAAKCNRLPTELIRLNVENFMEEQKNSTSYNGSILDLFGTKKMRTKTIVLSLNWFVISNLFYGVAQLMGQIAGNVFWNIFISGMVQIPGNILCVFICDCMGRKWSLILAYFITFVPLFTMLGCPIEPHWPRIVCGSISMMGCAMTFSIIYVYSGELLPTVVRNVGMGVNSMCARIGSMISPFVMYIRMYGDWIALCIFGIQPVIACLLTYVYLPETNKVALPDTIEEAENL